MRSEKNIIYYVQFLLRHTEVTLALARRLLAGQPILPPKSFVFFRLRKITHLTELKVMMKMRLYENL